MSDNLKYLIAGEATCKEVKNTLEYIKKNKKFLNNVDMNLLDSNSGLRTMICKELDSKSIFQSNYIDLGNFFSGINGLIKKINVEKNKTKPKSDARTTTKKEINPKTRPEDNVIERKKYEPIKLSNEDKNKQQTLLKFIEKEAEKIAMNERNKKGVSEKDLDSYNAILDKKIKSEINSLKNTILKTLENSGNYLNIKSTKNTFTYIPQIEPNTGEILGFVEQEIAVGFEPHEGVPIYVNILSSDPKEYETIEIGSMIDNGPVDLFVDTDKFGNSNDDNDAQHETQTSNAQHVFDNTYSGSYEDENIDIDDEFEKEENEQESNNTNKPIKKRRSNSVLNLKKMDNTFDKKWSVNLTVVDKQLLSTEDTENENLINDDLNRNLILRKLRTYIYNAIDIYKWKNERMDRSKIREIVINDIFLPYFKAALQNINIDEVSKAISDNRNLKIIPDVLNENNMMSYNELIRRYDIFLNNYNESDFDEKWFKKQETTNGERSSYYELYNKFKKEFNTNKTKGEYEIPEGLTLLLLDFNNIKPTYSLMRHDWAYVNIFNKLFDIEHTIYDIAINNKGQSTMDIIKKFENDNTSDNTQIVLKYIVDKLNPNSKSSILNYLVKGIFLIKYKIDVDTSFASKIKEYKKYLNEIDNVMAKAKANINKYKKEIEDAEDLLNRFEQSPGELTTRYFRDKLKNIGLYPDGGTLVRNKETNEVRKYDPNRQYDVDKYEIFESPQITAKNVQQILQNLIDDNLTEMDRTKESIKYMNKNKSRVISHYVNRDINYDLGLIPTIPDRYNKKEKIDMYVKAKTYGSREFMTVTVPYYENGEFKEEKIPMTFDEQVEYRHQKGYEFKREFNKKGWVKNDKKESKPTKVDSIMIAKGFVLSGKLWIKPEDMNKKYKRVKILVTDNGKDIYEKTKGATPSEFYNYMVASGKMLNNNRWLNVTEPITDELKNIIGNIIDNKKYTLRGDVWVNNDVIKNVVVVAKIKTRETTESEISIMEKPITVGEIYQALKELKYYWTGKGWKNIREHKNNSDSILKDVKDLVVNKFMIHNEYALFQGIWTRDKFNNTEHNKPGDLGLDFDFDILQPTEGLDNEDEYDYIPNVEKIDKKKFNIRDYDNTDKKRNRLKEIEAKYNKNI